jgi:hypothetical protein
MLMDRHSGNYARKWLGRGGNFIAYSRWYTKPKPMGLAGRLGINLKIEVGRNDSGCKVLRVDGRKCVPYNNLSLQPETRWPLYLRRS